MTHYSAIKFLNTELVLIDTPELAARYNCALNRLGMAPTSLARFSIDALGWSPEIAEEKQSPLYLCASVSNPMGIIVSPDQARAPLLYPFNSYDEPLLRQYFSRFQDEIADITRNQTLTLDFEQGLSRFQNPQDLELINSITVRSTAGEISNAAKQQNDLISRFTANNLNWLDSRLRQQILKSAKKHGDLRKRHLIVPDMEFSDFASFYTQAFNGMFILRTAKENTNIIVLEDAELPKKYGLDTWNTYTLNDSSLLARLEREGLIKTDLEYYRKNLEMLCDKKECLMADIICSASPGLDYCSLLQTQRKRKLFEAGAKVPEVLYQLERLLVQLSRNNGSVHQRITPALQRLLSYPNPALPLSEQALLWKLLSRFQSIDIYQLYRFDREFFYTEYDRWPRSKKTWAHQAISERFLSPATATKELEGKRR